MKKYLYLFLGLILILVIIVVVFKAPLTQIAGKITDKLFLPPTSKILTKLRVIYNHDAAATPVLGVATKLKLFEKYGVNAQVTETIGTAAIQNLIAGRSDISVAGQISYIKAAAAGASIKSIGVVNNNLRYVLVSNKNISDIKTYCSLGKTTETYLRGIKIMKNLGVNVDNLNFIYLASFDLCAKAMLSGEIDSAPFTEIAWERLKDQNPEVKNYKIIQPEDGVKYFIKPATIMVTGNILNTKKDAVENFSKAIIEANYWIINHNEKEIALTISGFNNLSSADANRYARLAKGMLQGVKFTQELSNVEENRKENEGITPSLKTYDVRNFLSYIISDDLKKQGFLQKFGF